jgi:uncharacterized ion transporter superfamily protein YfcC
VDIWNSGELFGAIDVAMFVLIIGTALGIFFVVRYAERVKKDPTGSLIYDMKAENEKQFGSGGGEGTEFGVFTGRHKAILLLFFLAFVVMVFGVIPWADLGLPIPTWWWFPEMTANFLLFGILIGIVGRLSEKTLVDTFVDGARDMLGVALIIGVARGTWRRFVWPLILLLAALSILVLAVGTLV